MGHSKIGGYWVINLWWAEGYWEKEGLELVLPRLRIRDWCSILGPETGNAVQLEDNLVGEVPR